MYATERKRGGERRTYSFNFKCIILVRFEQFMVAMKVIGSARWGSVIREYFDNQEDKRLIVK